MATNLAIDDALLKKALEIGGYTSGISDTRRFEGLKARLSALEDFKIETRDHETAAAFFTACRKHGIQGSHIDFLICAVAANNGMSIMTLDNDFLLYKKHLQIKLERIGWRNAEDRRR
ncbi:MAG: hypothetical protein M0Z80_01750 [Treponema sp.]|nr:hypothetical protein [Treponema sp.]